jgi:deoxyribodipyrimidine photo-lyase
MTAPTDMNNHAQTHTTQVIEPERIQVLNDNDIRPGSYVLYWMQQSQRAVYNHALEYAVGAANDLHLPVRVVFGLMDNYPDANLRHYTFMLEGLQDVRRDLTKRGIAFAVYHGNPDDVALACADDAALIVCDRGYLRHQRAWRTRVAGNVHCRFIQVESDVIVPVETASGKAEYAARTIRPRLLKQFSHFLALPSPVEPQVAMYDPDDKGLSLDSVSDVCTSLQLDANVPPVNDIFTGGTSHAEKIFSDFLVHSFDSYARNRNQPQTDDVSYMAMYLHFGQVSPVWLAREALKHAPSENADVFIEQLLVRRELAVNFVYYTDNYDSYDILPSWARTTLETHAVDQRKYMYTPEQLENAEIHDPYWNAAMREMKYTGYMHNYMRMYWGKKILEWIPSPPVAFDLLLKLNNKYFLDGRDPNSYAGVAWVFGQHDRAWPQKPVFGKVRSMKATGLERKCDINAYVDKVNKKIVIS